MHRLPAHHRAALAIFENQMEFILKQCSCRLRFVSKHVHALNDLIGVAAPTRRCRARAGSSMHLPPASSKCC